MTEENLVFLIECDSIFCHDWMSFASWYSIYKNIAGAQVFLYLKEKRNKQLFCWANKCKVPFYGEKNKLELEKKDIKIIQPTVMAVRFFDNDLSIVSSKSDIMKTLVDYKFGCGSFELNKWINVKSNPFQNCVKRFYVENITCNEIAVLNLWQRCYYVYMNLGGCV